MDDNGAARTSDVVAAAQWILANKDTYNIKVANFSLHSATATHFYYDPLDRAVEKLWLNGVVVVAAAGNYGTAAGPSGVLYSPGNDPFVITVGAVDIGSALRHPRRLGRALVGMGQHRGRLREARARRARPLHDRARLERHAEAAARADHVVSPDYMELSGTSFAAPVVAGAAAQLLALHPDWTPDQVKGALMLTAKQSARITNWAIGVGEVYVNDAAAVTTPPNPNAALDAFLTNDPANGLVFDAPAWVAAVTADASWSDASWSDASWSDASWARCFLGRRLVVGRLVGGRLLGRRFLGRRLLGGRLLGRRRRRRRDGPGCPRRPVCRRALGRPDPGRSSIRCAPDDRRHRIDGPRRWARRRGALRAGRAVPPPRARPVARARVSRRGGRDRRLRAARPPRRGAARGRPRLHDLGARGAGAPRAAPPLVRRGRGTGRGRAARLPLVRERLARRDLPPRALARRDGGDAGGLGRAVDGDPEHDVRGSHPGLVRPGRRRAGAARRGPDELLVPARAREGDRRRADRARPRGARVRHHDARVGQPPRPRPDRGGGHRRPVRLRAGHRRGVGREVARRSAARAGSSKPATPRTRRSATASWTSSPTTTAGSPASSR